MSSAYHCDRHQKPELQLFSSTGAKSGPPTARCIREEVVKVGGGWDVTTRLDKVASDIHGIQFKLRAAVYCTKE